MNVGFVSTRLAGTDGVSLETAKVAEVLRRQGHEIFYCAGELDGSVPGHLVPEIHFTDPVAVALGERAFGGRGEDDALLAAIGERAQALKEPLQQFLTTFDINYLIVENALAIPMQLPLGQALAELLEGSGLPALAHNHDFYWERERFTPNRLGTFLDRIFPPALPNLRQATINSLAQAALAQRRGLESVVLPNVFDFASPPPGIDAYNRDFREAIGLDETDWLIVQPTRVVPRKEIELAIELVARLDDARAKLVLTHPAGDEGLAYLERLQGLAVAKGVDLRYVAEQVDDRRGRGREGEKVYSLWDAYPHADLVTYPSLVEGFGNALIETIYFRKPALVNRYPVYVADIAPLGFHFAEIEGAVSEEAVATIRGWLEEPARWQPLVEENYRLGQEHFSYERLAQLLKLPG